MKHFKRFKGLKGFARAVCPMCGVPLNDRGQCPMCGYEPC